MAKKNETVTETPVFAPADRLGNDDLIARFVAYTTKANALRPIISEARDRLGEARKQMEASKAYLAWQAVHDEVKALGTCRELDSHAHVLALEAKARGISLPKVK